MPYIIAGIIVLAALIALAATARQRRYKAGQYYRVTGNSLDEVKKDPAKLSEYMVYARLKDYEKKGARFLFNIYIPIDGGRTTEIDAIMLGYFGIVVFECKSRYGWMEGAETDKEWSQFLFRRDGSLIENKLYNPIRQNRGHIAHLKKLLGGRIRMWSVIAFSENTDIDRISVSYPDTFVTHDEDLPRVVGNIVWNAPATLTDSDITSIYYKLYKCAKVSDAEKEKHIKDIKFKYLNGKRGRKGSKRK